VRKARGNHLGYFPRYPLGYPEPAVQQKTGEKREREIHRMIPGQRTLTTDPSN